MNAWIRRGAPLLFVAGVVVGCKKQAPPTSSDDARLERAAPADNSQKEVAQETVDEVLANFAKVYFDTDSAVLNSQSKQVLSRNAEIMQAHPALAIEVQGHADERGTTDYNLALGEKRAAAVRTFLLGAGVASQRVRTISFGEERPDATGRGASAWSANRRAEFRVLSGAPM